MADVTGGRTADANKAAEILIKSIVSPSGDLTVADAATKSGLSLQAAERGLFHLVNEYRGHLSATSQGEVLFRFPHGFKKPWETIDRLTAIWNKVKKGVLGVAKFVVRAWISVVMIAYVVIFAVILIGLSFASRSSDRDDGPSFGGTLLFHTLFRVVLDSLFWTFHPFSPFYAGGHRRHRHHGRLHAREKGLPFYEKVNQFFFGPEKSEKDPLEDKRKILAEIRAKKGRIGLADVMRVTGLRKEKADPLLAQLMLEYEGEVKVSESGGITYEFPEVRKTASGSVAFEPSPIWSTKEKLPPLTGNPAGSNFMIAGLNGFNLVMSLAAIGGGWTIEKIQYMIMAAQSRVPLELLPPMPEGTPLLLGWIPFWFSAVLFSFPIIRALFRSREKQKVDNENGRRGMLRAIFANLGGRGIKEETLAHAYKEHAGTSPSEKRVIHEVTKLGGDIEVSEDGTALFRFVDLEAEHHALRHERDRAKESEREVGEVVFSSAR